MENTKKSPALPEKIVFVDEVTGKITDEKSFGEVPDSIKFLPNADGEIEPVVKITEMTDGRQRIIKQFGYGDSLLKSTVQILED